MQILFLAICGLKFIEFRENVGVFASFIYRFVFRLSIMFPSEEISDYVAKFVEKLSKKRRCQKFQFSVAKTQSFGRAFENLAHSPTCGKVWLSFVL